jgi:hypothetical protein
MWAIRYALNSGAASVQLTKHASMYLIDDVMAYDTPTDDRLVANHEDPMARSGQSLNCLGCSGQKVKLGPVFYMVVAIFVDDTITIEKHRSYARLG